MADRLFLRPFEAADAQMFSRNVMSDPEFPAASGLRDSAELPDAGEYVLQRAGYAGRPHFYDFAVVRREDDEVIGGDQCRIHSAGHRRYRLCDRQKIPGIRLRNRGGENAGRTSQNGWRDMHLRCLQTGECRIRKGDARLRNGRDRQCAGPCETA